MTESSKKKVVPLEAMKFQVVLGRFASDHTKF